MKDKEKWENYYRAKINKETWQPNAIWDSDWDPEPEKWHQQWGEKAKFN